MRRVEFKTIIHNGMIELPKDGHEIKDKEVKVTIVWDEKNEKNFDSLKIGQILSSIRNKRVFNSIENPSEWQIDLRDEWE